VRRPLSVWLLPLPAIAFVSTATAQQRSFDLPAGPLGQASDALSHQAAISVILADPTLLERRVSAVRGRMSISEAVRRLARSAGADAVRLNRSGWKLTSAHARAPHVRPAALLRAAVETGPDVIVIASKRTTPLDAFAGSVETIDLPQIGIEGGTQALVTRSTIISSTYRGGGREKLFIRGISDSSFSGRLQSVTGLYFGDVRLTYSASDPDLQLYDMKSIEVLQGPQGTLYGSGSLAGVIRMNPVTPKRGRTEATIGGGVSVTHHGSQGADLTATINVPLTDNLAVRTVSYVRREPGYIDKPAVGRNLNYAMIQGGRMIARWWIEDSWTLDVTGMVQSSRSGDTQYTTIGARSLTDLGVAAEPFGSDYAAAHLVVSGRMGGVDVVSATGLASQDFRERFAFVSFGRTRQADARRLHNMMTHETRFNRRDDDGLSWVAGISYTRPVSRSKYRDDGIIVAFPSISVRNAVSETAIFGEGSVRIAPFLTLGAGVRAVQAITKSQIGASPGIYANPRLRESWLLPTASAVIQPQRSVSAYIRYQQGARAKVPLLEPTVVTDETLDERVATSDVGVRWHVDNGWMMAASISRTRWSKLQVDTFEAFTGFITGHADDWRILSAHLALGGPILPELRIDAAATFNDNKPARPVAKGLRVNLPDIADVIAQMQATWSRPVGGAAKLNVNIWGRYEGRSYGSFLFYDRQRQGNYVRTGVVIDLDHAEGRSSLSVDNLFDNRGDRYALGTLTRAGEITTPLRPLTARIGYLRHF